MRHGSLRIVLIDTDTTALGSLAAELGAAGWNDVVTFCEAREALKVLCVDHCTSDVVCCELHSPGFDGFEFIRHLGAIHFSGGLVLASGVDIRLLNTAQALAATYSLRMLAGLPSPLGLRSLELPLAIAARSAAAQAKREDAPCHPADLQLALQRHELVNHYQPLVHLRSGELVGLETLVRWNHPHDGLVMPDQFIAVAEDHGMIEELLHEVLLSERGAIQQAAKWQAMGLNMRVSVNVSMGNLCNLAFPDLLVKRLSEAGLFPSKLMLEVTESKSMVNPQSTLEVLGRLRLNGIGVSVDDFGTGHSSLTQLRDIPFDELKVDRSFVHRAFERRNLRAILLPTLSIAKQLGMISVAEGVELEEDWRFLQDCGCPIAQGYFIGRPMPPEDVPAWLERWRIRWVDLSPQHVRTRSAQSSRWRAHQRGR